MRETEIMMQRCIRLASLGAGQVAPNPMVGAVLVHEGVIIGEGYHEHYGQAHAEVNCVESVPENKRQFIREATMYVSLEPCAHFGKTPPCTDLIIAQQIPRVLIGCMDPFAKVAGKGIKKLKEAGVEVVIGVEENACRDLNKRFFTFHKDKRPYLILKWAQSADGFIALQGPKPVRLSHPLTDRLVHRWRSEEAGILIGSGTALADDPQLTNRLWTGKSPIRIVLDRKLRLPEHLKVFNGEVQTLVFNTIKNEQRDNTTWIRIAPEGHFLDELLKELYQRKILSVMIEGGAEVLKAFIDAGLWDEARAITGKKWLVDGLQAPVLKTFSPIYTDEVEEDQILYYIRPHG